MAIWYILLLSVILGAMANEHPSNPPFPLEEVTTTVNTLILQRVQNLSRTVNDEMKILNDRAEKLLEELSDNVQSFSTSTTQRMINLEQKLERIPEDTGVYFMRPDPSEVSFEVSRDWTNNHGFGGGWTVFQRRFNGSVDFYRNWTEYKNGFGDLRGEHWLGLDKLHAIVETRRHELLIVLQDFDGVFAYAHYDDFKIGDENEKYIIKSVGNYTGTASDSFKQHKENLFSTHDQDNDKSSVNCAALFRGAWWFEKCFNSHLNGEYLKDKTKIIHGSKVNERGIAWNTFRGLSYSLKSTKMMIRPVAGK